MLVNQTIDRLRELRLLGMIRELEIQSQTPKYLELSFDERLGFIVDREATERQNRRYMRRIKDARLKEMALIEDVDWRQSRQLDKSVFMSLASCQWIREHQNIIFTGKTGAGKSWLSCALAERACQEGFSVYFVRIRRFFDDLASSRLDGTYARLRSTLARQDVLILDDWGAKLVESERRELAEVVDDRVGSGSLIITSQVPINKWHEVIGDPSVADSILDRIVHRAHQVPLSGDSLRGEYQSPGRAQRAPSDQRKNK